MKKNEVTIERMSEKTLKEASKLNLKIFGNNPEDIDYPTRWFKASLSPDKYKKLYKKTDTKHTEYYVAINKESGKVIGTSGLYMLTTDDEETCWLGWFCVDEKFRGMHVGSRLLEYSINCAKKMGKKKFKLYTSTDKKEANAQLLYEKKGFKIIGEEAIPGKSYKKLYRQLNL